MDKTLDLLLLHVSREAPTPPFIYVLSMGLFSLAEYVQRHGKRVQIVNYWLEKYLDENFSLIAYLKQFQVPLLGISLHRHQQAFDTIKTIQEVKKALPDLKIVLGGKTATFFAQEILEEYPEIDFVITGDGEFPLLQLSNYLSNEIEDISIIPNLVYRDERNAIIKNFAHFEITPENYQEFSFSDISLVKNSEKYLKIRQDSLSEKRENVYFSCGRGCSGNCVFCAGSRVSEQKYAIRTAPFFYDIPYVINELKKLIESWITSWNSCFDPYPNSAYYLALFKEIRRQHISINHIFDCFWLPSEEFIDEFSQTFGEHSALNISPETWSEMLRKRIKSFFYDNASLYERLEYLHKKGIHCSVYFSTWFPFETYEDLLLTLEMIVYIQHHYPDVEIFANVIDLEPGSTLFMYQKQFWIQSNMINFKEIVERQKEKLPINFSTEHFTAQEIVANWELLQKVIACG